ncbi:related to PET112 protein [Phialocephala subalpina]|uniref:Glutamyl-tRNA(Gln) amidotransferase subunit B, mitochondrial n=1 Tax=Phialocephala subalpina TaxID=576137 RepID=A0A1L7XV22_9HELO|nr:related to PET112 protein [Phialocephala subalpina]
MARFTPVVLRRYLFGGQLPGRGCLRQLRHRQTTQSLYSQRHHTTLVEDVDGNAAWKDAPVAFRKQLKGEKKLKKAQGKGKRSQSLEEWELTVGIEIHAQLNTARKLFSSAASTIDEEPNSHVALFDVAMPGSQPIFQKETLIPAVRAALALNCDINRTSRFDRKHYFHWDQPSGYQITQYYEPFAKDGYITLYAHDGIAKEDGDSIQIGIKQIQMEQDTAKTMSQPGDIHLLDFNRVGLPLIEIITLPQIHHPSTAAALVRKIQTILESVDACVLGMQSGGLRADVNVSVSRRDGFGGSHEYGGVKGLGQRTEIKNLSSFKAVEDAIIAERDRQIDTLEAGGVIEGETRGWTIGEKTTKRLRGKEGEVDYRYMPDPDIAPVVIGADLLHHLQHSMPVLPDEEINTLVEEYGLTAKDAMSLTSHDNGGRAEYFYNVVDDYMKLIPDQDLSTAGRLCGNWVLHEMGGLSHPEANEGNPLGITDTGDCLIKATSLAHLLHLLIGKKITGKTAKKVLAELFEAGIQNVDTGPEAIVDRLGLWYTPLSNREYVDMAKTVLDANVMEEILAGKTGKLNFLVGQMMRMDTEGSVDPQQATAVLQKLIKENWKS